MNPLFTAYARVHGRTACQQIQYDKAQYPGGCMCGFILWMSTKRDEFWKLHREAFLDRYTIGDIQAWYKFIRESK